MPSPGVVQRASAADLKWKIPMLLFLYQDWPAVRQVLNERDQGGASRESRQPPNASGQRSCYVRRHQSGWTAAVSCHPRQKDGFELCTVDHQKDGTICDNATISYIYQPSASGTSATCRCWSHQAQDQYAPRRGDYEGHQHVVVTVVQPRSRHAHQVRQVDGSSFGPRGLRRRARGQANYRH